MYHDAKSLFEDDKFSEAETAFNFVVEILHLGKTQNFHHTREYLAKYDFFKLSSCVC